jgi:polyhydroxyalkanoate synthase
MDLQPDRSLIRNLLGLGVDIYLVDWGYPTRPDRYLSLDDYINGYIDDCVEHIRQTTGAAKVNLLGVCQGGTMSTIYSALHPEKVNSLITMVTPIDFNTEDGLLFKWSRDLNVDSIVDSYGGIVPGDFLNFGFDLLKPFGKLRKYNNLGSMLDDKDKLMNFLRMEKWVGDRPDQAGEAYRQFIKDLYQQNKLIKGELVVGEKVDLKKIDMPLLNIYASDDHMVPPSATKPLNDYVSSKDKQLYEFPGGHIGVFVGGRSQKELGPTIAKWLKDRSN